MDIERAFVTLKMGGDIAAIAGQGVEANCIVLHENNRKQQGPLLTYNCAVWQYCHRVRDCMHEITEMTPSDGSVQLPVAPLSRGEKKLQRVTRIQTVSSPLPHAACVRICATEVQPDSVTRSPA